MSVEILPDILPILELTHGGEYRPAPGDGLPPDQATAWAEAIQAEVHGGRTVAFVLVEAVRSDGEDVQIGLVRPPMPGPRFEAFLAGLNVALIWGAWLAEPTATDVVLDASLIAAIPGA